MGESKEKDGQALGNSSILLKMAKLKERGLRERESKLKEKENLKRVEFEATTC